MSAGADSLESDCGELAAWDTLMDAAEFDEVADRGGGCERSIVSGLEHLVPGVAERRAASSTVPAVSPPVDVPSAASFMDYYDGGSPWEMSADTPTAAVEDDESLAARAAALSLDDGDWHTAEGDGDAADEQYVTAPCSPSPCGLALAGTPDSGIFSLPPPPSPQHCLFDAPHFVWPQQQEPAAFVFAGVPPAPAQAFVQTVEVHCNYWTLAQLHVLPPAPASFVVAHEQDQPPLPPPAPTAALSELRAGRAKKARRGRADRRPAHCGFCANNYRSRATEAGVTSAPMADSDVARLSAHDTYDCYGLVACAWLRQVRCKHCEAPADYAHSDKYCPLVHQMLDYSLKNE